MNTPATITLTALETANLDTKCYRGSAKLSELAILSQADIFDQIDNPQGLQRELSAGHAKNVYDYAAREPIADQPRAFPEVILNVRAAGKRCMSFDGGDKVPVHSLTFDVAKLLKLAQKGTVAVSRVDGNHRLWFGAGDQKNRAPLDVEVPFQLHIGLTPDQERGLFVDINAEQKGLNTSHLHTQRLALTTEDVEMLRHPERVFARRLADDVASPFHGRVFLGGSRKGLNAQKLKPPVTFTALESAIKRLMRSEYLRHLSDSGARYGLIRNYWKAVELAHPDAFAEPSKYLILKNMGLQSLAALGTRVLDRSMATGRMEVEDMAELLRPAMAALNWGTDSPDVAGMSGNQATRILAERMEQALPALAT